MDIRIDDIEIKSIYVSYNDTNFTLANVRLKSGKVVIAERELREQQLSDEAKDCIENFKDEMREHLKIGLQSEVKQLNGIVVEDDKDKLDDLF